MHKPSDATEDTLATQPQSAASAGVGDDDRSPPASTPSSLGTLRTLAMGRFADRIVATREVPARSAQYAEVPRGLHVDLRQALTAIGIEELYTHQAEAFESSRRGEHVVVTTGTASGKSLAFLLPVLQAIAEDPSARALLIYPTKALSHDQLRSVLRLCDYVPGLRIEAGVYDGDTPPAERTRIRDRAHLVLTNPDMLNAALLPHHGRQGFSHVFRNVRYVVVDELHGFRGAFGAHLANVMRRLLRVCRHYGSTPQFLCSSATIANAKEHAETVCHRPFSLIDQDGSPSAGKVIHFWQPPMREDGTRRLVTSEMTSLLPHLIEQRHRTIAFCRSRKETEIVLKESRDRLSDVAGHDESYLLGGYRGGYTPEERRKVEKSLVEGKLLGVVSTNALELGIDIGALEVVIQGGFPGTRASFWQQLGRAGRRGKVAHGIVMLAQTPEDQFIADQPDWLVGQPAEHAVVDRDNLAIQLAHVRAAAAELPLSIDDAALFPDLGEIVAVLSKANELRNLGDAWHWTGGPFPAGDLSLRNVDPDRFKVVNRQTGRTITEMDRPQVYREGHPRAVYLHDGIQYQVETLDLVGHVATVVEVQQNFYTQPDVRTAIDVLLTQEHKHVGRVDAQFGDVRVDDAVVGFKMLEFHNHQNLGYEQLHEPLRIQLETEALWLTVPEDVLQVLGSEKRDALVGMVHAFSACARLRTMAERMDLRGTSFHFADEETGRTHTALICYDSHPGGLGYAAKAFDFAAQILDEAIRLVEGCRCPQGCPACVGDYVRDKRLIAWALRGLRETTPAPAFAARPSLPRQEAGFDQLDAPRMGWADVGSRYIDLLHRLRQRGAFGAEALATVLRAAVHGDRLVLQLGSPGLAQWLQSEATHVRLRQAIEACVVVPAGWRLDIEVAADERDSALRKSIKLQRRHDDLTKDFARDGHQATEKLDGGWIAPRDDSVN